MPERTSVASCRVDSATCVRGQPQALRREGDVRAVAGGGGPLGIDRRGKEALRAQAIAHVARRLGLGAPAL